MIEKEIVLVLGNGVSIDLINKLNKSEEIDLVNLFNKGDSIPWPGDGKPGFLSQMHCPELWKLGARPSNNRGDSQKLIEDIITCANVSAISEHPKTNSESSNVYIRAYHELVSYLRYLFVYYNNKVSDDSLESIASDWGWSKLLKNLNMNKEISRVTIITYNYDIFLVN